MAWVRFTGAFDCHLRHGVVKVYPLGRALNIPSRPAAAAIAAGKAEAVKRPATRAAAKALTSGS